MNRNIKRIIALALVFGTVSAVAPATNLNLLTTKAYASTNDDDTLSSLELQTSSGSTIRLYDDSDYGSDSKVDSDDVSEGHTYYAKTSSDTVNIDTSGVSSSYVKIFKGTSDSTRGKSESSDISLSSRTTTLTVRIYDQSPDSNVRYDNDDEDADIIGTYTIKVEHTGGYSDSSTSTYNADDYDNIYLDRLSVDGESISLSDSKIAYTYNVASNIDEVTVKAEPEYDDYTVKIGGKEVDEYDKWKTNVSLKTGVNEFKIKIEDEDNNDERVYTLKITRGSTAATSTSTVAEAAAVTNVKPSQWIQVNGKWQYNDALGNPIKNTWFFDKNLGKNYYLQFDGSMATGWLPNNGKWYYLGTNGAMNTGWIIDGGKYYYLDPASGVMASNTKIGLYKLGSDGAWIK